MANTENPSMIVPENPVADTVQTPSEDQDDKPWFLPSVKGVDRGRPPPAPAASNRIPVIKLYGVNNFFKLGNLLQENMEKRSFYFVRYSGHMALEIKNISNFVEAVKLLDELGVQYSYKNMLEDKSERYKLRGVPAECESEISLRFAERGITVHDVYRLNGNKSTLRSPTFVMVHTPSPGGPRLTDIKILGRWEVKIKTYKITKNEPMLCFRCCRYGHMATFCTANPRCFKCAGEHEGDGCAEPEASRACCNCDGRHPSISKICPMYKLVKYYLKVGAPLPSNSKFAKGLQISLVGNPPAHKFIPAELTPKRPPNKLIKIIARSFVAVAWDARGTDVDGCTKFLGFLKAQGAQLVCVTGSSPLSEGKWHSLGWSVLVPDASRGGKKAAAVAPKLLIRRDVPHTRLTAPPLKHMTTVFATVVAKGVRIKVAAAYVGPNDSLVPEDLEALLKGPEPMVVFGDMYARHNTWGSPGSNKRGKTLNRSAISRKFTVSGPKNPVRSYRDEDVPFVVLTKGFPRAPLLFPKRLKNGGAEHLCPLVMHLRNIRKPKMGKKAALPVGLMSLVLRKNRLRRQWRKKRSYKIRSEFNITKAVLKSKLSEFRREARDSQVDPSRQI